MIDPLLFWSIVVAVMFGIVEYGCRKETGMGFFGVMSTFIGVFAAVVAAEILRRKN